MATKLCHIVVGRKITYANGVVINTGFVTNLEQDTALRTAPKLYERLRSAELAGERKVAPLYEYPKNVLTAAMMDCWSRRGIHFRVKRGECTELHTLDAQKAEGKKLFGGGYLLSDEAAARKVAAQAENEARKERNVWHLSEREKELVRELNGKEN